MTVFSGFKVSQQQQLHSVVLEEKNMLCYINNQPRDPKCLCYWQVQNFRTATFSKWLKYFPQKLLPGRHTHLQLTALATQLLCKLLLYIARASPSYIALPCQNPQACWWCQTQKWICSSDGHPELMHTKSAKGKNRRWDAKQHLQLNSKTHCMILS